MTSSSTSGAQPTGDPNISWPTERLSHLSHPDSEWHPSFTRNPTPSSISESSDDTPDVDPSNYPTGSKSLSGISLRAFLLGTSLGLTTSLTLLLTVYRTPFWRIPFFVAALSLFHFLEFFVTARYNTPYATVKAFLLSSNGWAYNAAHGSALLECLISHYFWPGQSSLGRMLSVSGPFGSVSLLLVVGLVLTALGQVVRTLAMATAAGNFNHHVQVEHKAGHVLVKSGLYRFLRHPSYFGFFWWGLGTQLVLGNVVCFVGYAVVLWRFFATRIKRESLLFSWLRV
jgi:protein-S-isoprenylcysteine O-methyltransferase